MNNPNPIKILVVDDSPTVRQMLVNLLSAQPNFQVIGEAENGEEAVRLTQRLQPDVISMDIHMPVMDGFEATRQIMRSHPTPIVVVSASLEKHELDVAFNAIQDGALATLQKPPHPGHPDYPAMSGELISTLAAMSEVAVIHHWPSRETRRPVVTGPLVDLSSQGKISVIGIASSTGGPGALATILGQLPADFAVPIVIVQHISEGFDQGLAQWLDGLTPLRVTMAQAGQSPTSGAVMVAPSGVHLRFSRSGRAILDPERGPYINVPAGDVMLTSLAEVYGGSTMGVVLTGMGADGAQGLRDIYDAGGMTLAQDEASSVVFGMPKEAIALGAARHILPLDKMARTIAALARNENIAN